jgi:plastocyanin
MRNSWIGLAGLVVLTGCGAAPETTVAPSRKPAPIPKAEVQAGTIFGQVNFSGDKSASKPISMDSVPACAKQHPMVIQPEDLIVNRNGTLRNVFIHLKTGVPSRDWPMPTTNVQLDQKGCVYSPRVVALRIGQTLEIGNADKMNHNVHPTPRRNPEFNEVQPPGGDKMMKRFTTPETMIPFVCNVHPWMRAFVNVVEHPFFTVTGNDGSFNFAGVPPGEYEIEAIHEVFGAKTFTVSIGNREERSVMFAFRPN